MPRYFVTRTLPPLTEEQLTAVGKKVVETCDQLGMQWIRSHITTDGKHSFCEFEAPNADVCREHARLAGLPVDDVISLGAEIGPRQFK
jgi:microsomal dipeptidase-like Zn-dependent dipeptidase